MAQATLPTSSGSAAPRASVSRWPPGSVTDVLSPSMRGGRL